MEQQFLFKSSFTGTKKNSTEQFTIIELHDPLTLENITFFPPVNSINTNGMVLKTPVKATLQMSVFNGKPTMVLNSLVKG